MDGTFGAGKRRDLGKVVKVEEDTTRDKKEGSRGSRNGGSW